MWAPAAAKRAPVPALKLPESTMTTTRPRLPEADPLCEEITPCRGAFKAGSADRHRQIVKTGGKGIRTPDLLIANETLYQLSYTPEIFGELALKLQTLICISTATPPVLPP